MSVVVLKPKLAILLEPMEKEKDLLVIENVPVISCPSCGTSYLTSLTLKEIDRIKRDHAVPGFA